MNATRLLIFNVLRGQKSVPFVHTTRSAASSSEFVIDFRPNINKNIKVRFICSLLNRIGKLH